MCYAHIVQCSQPIVKSTQFSKLYRKIFKYLMISLNMFKYVPVLIPPPPPPVPQDVH